LCVAGLTLWIYEWTSRLIEKINVNSFHLYMQWPSVLTRANTMVFF
jgi:hypothetical protein